MKERKLTGLTSRAARWSGLSTGRMFTLLYVSLMLVWAVGCRSGLPPVIFTSDRDGNLELYTVHLDGGEQNLTSNLADEFSPVVSPDGKLLAFLSGSGDAIALEVMGVNGTGRQQLTLGPGAHGSQRWSPDGDRIAYLVQAGQDSLIYVINTDASQRMPLTSLTGHQVGGWSPTGKSVVFAVREEPNQGIYIRNPDGVNEFRLTDTADFSPAWSPDSKKIVLLSERDGNREIYVMNVMKLKRVTNHIERYI